MKKVTLKITGGPCLTPPLLPHHYGLTLEARDAALPQVQGWDAAHDQVARARAYASVG